VVLMYHYFGESPSDPECLFVTERAFAAQLEHLRRHGWRALSLDEYLAALDGAPTPRRSYLVTIDDGHESVARIGAPMLAKAGVPSVLFVCPSLLGDRARWAEDYPDEVLISADGLRKLAGLGVELGVHGWDHTRMIGMDAAALERHVADARTELRTATNINTRAFAYPYGTHDDAARAAVEAAGYDTAFAVAREQGRFAVDRVFVRSTDSLPMFRLKLTLGYRLISRMAGRAWRVRHAVRDTVALLRPKPVMDHSRTPATRTHPVAEFTRRAADLTGALLLLVLLSAPMLIIAAAVRLQDGGPVLFRQQRVGRDRRPFAMAKFRTMTVGADDTTLREQVARELRGEDTTVDGSSKISNDRRVTPLGAFLRRTSLDELPQLINVLLGDMGLVGPRPCLDWEAQMFPARYQSRFDVRPGITGLWQVSGRSTLGTLEMLQLDADYVRDRTLRLDARILVKTVPVVLRQDGAR
jgi:lipopolysaccharide/colanic/teichoic acid biosynthesis glycosyltransferase